MTVQTQETLLKKLHAIDQMPTLPVVLTPLLHYMEQPLERLEVQQVVDLISQDKSLTAQCLQLANSPLFGQWQKIDSVRAAVMALGMQRMRDVAMSCSVLTLLPRETAGFDPIVFWEHSLGCALVCRQFARKIGFSEPGKAYLAGLLHDIGIIAQLWVAPAEFRATMERASAEHIPLHELSKLYSELITPRAAGLWLSAGTSHPISCRWWPPSTTPAKPRANARCWLLSRSATCYAGWAPWATGTP